MHPSIAAEKHKGAPERIKKRSRALNTRNATFDLYCTFFLAEGAPQNAPDNALKARDDARAKRPRGRAWRLPVGVLGNLPENARSQKQH